MAVDRDEAKKLQESDESSKHKDKRNLYLSNEGLLIDTRISMMRHGNAQ